MRDAETEAALHIIKAAREAIGQNDSEDSVGGASEKRIAARTKADYKQKAKRLIKDTQNISADTIEEELKKRLNRYKNPNSFFANRAALVFAVSRNIEQLLIKQSDIAKQEGHSGTWLDCCHQIKVYFALRSAIAVHQRPTDISLPARGSKRHDLKTIGKRYPDWRERILNELGDKRHYDAVLVLALIGCRPEELVTGVTVSSNLKQNCISFVVKGAKVTRTSGQPERTIHLPIERLPMAWGERLAAGTSFEVRVASKDGLRCALRRASKVALPGMPVASAYVFRHAFATELREDGHDSETVAACLGHATSDTQNRYGRRARRSGKTKPEVQVETSKRVRSVDKTGLNQLIKAGPSRRLG